MLLTIAIPTYNRRTVLDVVHALVVQEFFFDIELLILDNCSDIPVINLLEGACLMHLSNIKVIRHKANIGSVANIIRCVEEATGEWVALLSDDDLPAYNYLATILASIAENDIATVIKLGLINYPQLDLWVRSMSELIEYLDCGNGSRFGSFICISNTVIKRNFFLKNIKFAYQYSGTCIPHLIPLIVGFGEEQSMVRFVSQSAVEWNRPTDDQMWSLLDVHIGFATLPLVPCEMSLQTALQYSRIIRIPLKTLVLRIAGLSRYKSKPSAQRIAYYACRYFNYGIIGTIKLPHFACWFAANYPSVIETVALRVYGKKLCLQTHARS